MAAEYKVPTRLWNKGFILIFMANLLQHMGQQTITTLIPKYANAMGAAATVVGIASSAFAISALISKPFTSPASICYKKRNVYLCASIIYLAAYTVFYLAPNVTWLIIGRLLQGIGTGIAAPIALSLACEHIPETSFAKGVSMFSLGQAFGQAIGPSVGLKLSRTIGYKATFAICFCVMIGCIIVTLFVTSKPPAEGARYRIRFDTIIDKRALLPAITMTFITISYSCISGFLAIYGDLLGIVNIGLYFTVYAIAILVLRFVTGGLADRFGYRKVLLASLFCFAMTFVMFSVSRTLTGFIVAALFSALGYGLTLPNIQALCMSSVPADRRSVGSNTLYLFQDLGQFAGPWMAGMLIDALILRKSPSGADAATAEAKISAYSTMYLVIIISIVIAMALVVVMTKKSGQASAKEKKEE